VSLGIIVGVGISFVLEKNFIRVSLHGDARPEASWFLCFYLLGRAVYWPLAVVVGALLALPDVLPRPATETVGRILGGEAMSVTTCL
jgi:hypothetical protein